LVPATWQTLRVTRHPVLARQMGKGRAEARPFVNPASWSYGTAGKEVADQLTLAWTGGSVGAAAEGQVIAVPEAAAA